MIYSAKELRRDQLSNLIPNDIKAALESKRSKPFTELELAFMESYVENDFNAKSAGKDLSLQSGQLHALTRRLKNELIELMQAKLIIEAGVAVNTMVNILTSTDPIVQGELKFKAAQDIMNRIGLAKQEVVQHNHQVSGGLFIIPDKQDVILGELDD